MDMGMVATVVDTLNLVLNKGMDIQQEDINNLSMVTTNFNWYTDDEIVMGWLSLDLHCIVIVIVKTFTC